MYSCRYICLAGIVLKFNARKRKVKPLRASQILSEILPCTGYEVFPLKGAAPTGNRLRALEVELVMCAA